MNDEGCCTRPEVHEHDAGIDVGGTFTDLAWSTSDRRVRIARCDDDGNQAVGVLASRRGGIDEAHVEAIVHGTNKRPPRHDRAQDRERRRSRSGAFETSRAGRRTRPTPYGLKAGSSRSYERRSGSRLRADDAEGQGHRLRRRGAGRSRRASLSHGRVSAVVQFLHEPPPSPRRARRDRPRRLAEPVAPPAKPSSPIPRVRARHDRCRQRIDPAVLARDLERLKRLSRRTWLRPECSHAGQRRTVAAEPRSRERRRDGDL